MWALKLTLKILPWLYMHILLHNWAPSCFVNLLICASLYAPAAGDTNTNSQCGHRLVSCTGICAHMNNLLLRCSSLLHTVWLCMHCWPYPQVMRAVHLWRCWLGDHLLLTTTRHEHAPASVLVCPRRQCSVVCCTIGLEICDMLVTFWNIVEH